MGPQQQIDIARIHQLERERWLKQEAPSRSLAEVIGSITKYFIVIVFLVAYALSAQHTASVINLISPGWGFVAPVGIELGIIFVAFTDKRLSLQGDELPNMFKGLRILFFTVAILTNFAGGLDAVTSSVKVSDLSAGDILAKLTSLPIIAQTALIMVIVMAVAIPLIAEVAGHGIADLIYASKENDFRELRWRKVQVQQTYRATFVHYTQQGLTAAEARQIANQAVSAYFSSVNRQLPSLVSAVSNPVSETSETVKQKVKQASPDFQKSIEWLKEYPDMQGLTIRQAADVAGVHYSTFYRAKKKLESSES